MGTIMNRLSTNTTLTLALALTLVFALFTAFPGAGLAADHGSHGSAHESPQATEQKNQIYTATGIVNGIDKTALKATITHDPVPALGWPSMTMGFAFEDASLLEDLKEGDAVRFDFRNQGNTSVIVDMEARN